METLTVEGFLGHWQNASTKLEQNIENIKNTLGPDMVDLFKKNIEFGTYFGAPWRNIKPETLQRRQRRLKNYPPIANGAPVGSGLKPLLERGVLWGSIVYSNRKFLQSGFKTHIYLDPRKYRLEDSRHQYIYGRIHNSGEGRIPQRQFIPTNNDGVDNRPDVKLTLNTLNQRVFMGLPGMIFNIGGAQPVRGSHY